MIDDQEFYYWREESDETICILQKKILILEKKVKLFEKKQ